jgi:hypothetical protein
MQEQAGLPTAVCVGAFSARSFVVCAYLAEQTCAQRVVGLRAFEVAVALKPAACCTEISGYDLSRSLKRIFDIDFIASFQ